MMGVAVGSEACVPPSSVYELGAQTATGSEEPPPPPPPPPA